MNALPEALDQRFRDAAAAAGLVDVSYDIADTPVKLELEEYFEGRRHEFDLPVDLRGRSDFSRVVLEHLARVPYGEVTTYGSLAARSGRPKAARAVGTIMNRNPVPIVLPCHRVVGSTGSLVGYGGGLERKRLLLDLEHAPI
jgi:methylated-DNA-[protein]-cysteine S-methyltransferase